MPSLDAPGYYDRAKFTAAGNADDFLKSLSIDDSIDDLGDVNEFPLGHLMLVNVTRDMIAEYVTREGDPWMSERRNFEPGWYIVKTDSNGLIWGIGYGEDCTFNEEAARADWNEALRVWIEWSDAHDEV